MFNMLASNDGTPEAYKALTTIGSPRVEVGLRVYGLRGRTATYTEEKIMRSG